MSRDFSRRPFNSRPADVIDQISAPDERERKTPAGGLNPASGSTKKRAPKFAAAVNERTASHPATWDQAGAADQFTPASVPFGDLKTVCVIEAFTAIRQLTVNYINQIGRAHV